MATLNRKKKLQDEMDNMILDVIFDPEHANLFSFEKEFGKTSTHPENELSLDADSSLQQQQRNEIGNNSEPLAHVNQMGPELLNKCRELELFAIKETEKENWEGSLKFLNDCIQLDPLYPSAYNNRCQVYRQLKNYENAWEDIHQAIKLGVGDPNVLKQAYTQRAVMRRFNQLPSREIAKDEMEDAHEKEKKNNRDSGNNKDGGYTEEEDELLQRYCLSKKDEKILRDFELGAKYGNRLAAHCAAKRNPYAAMCNDMLRAVFSQYESPPSATSSSSSKSMSSS